MFLAILGHDLRTPLGAVMMSAEFMLETKEVKEPHLTPTSQIASSSARMNHMIDALLDFTRSRLGGGIPIVRADMHMGKVVQSTDRPGTRPGASHCRPNRERAQRHAGNPKLEVGPDGQLAK